jgi:hypothetical protein
MYVHEYEWKMCLTEHWSRSRKKVVNEGKKVKKRKNYNKKADGKEFRRTHKSTIRIWQVQTIDRYRLNMNDQNIRRCQGKRVPVHTWQPIYNFCLVSAFHARSLKLAVRTLRIAAKLALHFLYVQLDAYVKQLRQELTMPNLSKASIYILRITRTTS